jgi:hypothetical protein
MNEYRRFARPALSLDHETVVGSQIRLTPLTWEITPLPHTHM